MIAQDIRLGLTSRQIRAEIIAKVGMMADARTPTMQARYDAAVERERVAASVVHILSQEGQPYGSERRCCNHCGAMIWGSASPSFLTSWTEGAQVLSIGGESRPLNGAPPYEREVQP